MSLISLSIRYNKIDGFIKIYYGIRYLVIFNHNSLDKTCDKIRSYYIRSYK